MSSFSIHGVGVSNGIAIGRAHLVSNALLEVSHYKITPERVSEEIARLTNAIETVKHDLNVIHEQLSGTVPAELGGFIKTHLMMLEDQSLSEKPKEIIRTKLCNAEWAIKLKMDIIVKQFNQIEDEYLRERKQDVIQVVERVMKVLLGHPSQFTDTKASEVEAESESILVAHDISPADALQFKHHQFAAFITDGGGVTSHTAILARSLNIPSIVALQRARDLINNGELIIIDGNSGTVIVNPSEAILNEYQLRQATWKLEQQKLQRIKSTKAVTLYGTQIALLGNIEVPEDVKAVKSAGGAGIGLYRTEFLFMNRREMPNEEEQFIAYKNVVKSMKGLPVTIRTLDLGADKLMNPDTSPTSNANPALGLRAIRYSLTEPQIFLVQLRALLRASHFGKIKILIPMITILAELRQTKALLERAKQSLRDQKIPFDENIQLGGMIEIPAAAINSEAIAKELDFLSIGTNDLIQYTLAIDRTDDSVSHLYNPLHPSILKLINMTVKACEKHGKAVSLCGEMAGDPKLTKLLVGMGLRELSMHPSHILQVKQQVLHSEIKKLDKIVKKILTLTDLAKIELLVNKMNQNG
jgi:phosphotransferase system enzyme I (PtsI)